MTKQRARQRTERQARADRDRAARAQRQRPAARRPGARRGRGRTGRVGLRRTRNQRIGISVLTALGIVVIWLLAPTPLAVALSVLLLLALPAFVVLTLGRRY